jgi:predicted  nucleic acid-binding Zn-ribbon protein
MPDRITLDRKEFETFLQDNQKLVENSGQLMKKIEELEKTNRQLRDELQASRAKVDSMQSTMASSTREADDTIRKARETMARIIQETEKRLSS